MLFEALIFLGVLLVWWYNQDKKRFKGYPPGPQRFPVLGNLPQIALQDPNPAKAFQSLAKTYGDVMFINVGQLDAVVCTSHDTIMEILNHDKAIDRGTYKIPAIQDRNMNQNLGVIWSNDDVWSNIRRFTLRTLRDFGFGKTLSMDFVINEELDKFTAHIDKLILESNPQGKGITGTLCFDGFFDQPIVNILWRLVTGNNYELGDPTMNKLLKISNDYMKVSSFAFDISIGFPFLRRWFPSLFDWHTMMKHIKSLHEFGNNTVAEHRQLQNYMHDPKGFVDIFLQKIEGYKGETHPHFNDNQLLMTILDLFQAGSETTSKTLGFGILYMVLNPKVQEKVRQEVNAVIPHNEQIILETKARLPYTYATLLEVLRHSSVVPFTPMRQASDDFVFHGYDIKKGTAILPNVYAAHFSPSVWGDPNAFRPERFLTAEGGIDSKMESFVIPFGGGKRVCAGKNLADASLFLYFTTLLRRYKFEKIPNTPEPSPEPVVGMTSTPQVFRAIVTRHKY